MIHQFLERRQVDLVLDVGANIGQFAQRLREAGFRGRIVSLEPLSEAHEALVCMSEKDPDWIIAPRAAIGDSDGETTIHVSRNLVSSSLLEMADLHRRITPSAHYTNAEPVRLARLDTIARDYVVDASAVFLKIDTQGYEWPVIEGARGLLDKVVGMQVELSVSPLYEGQMLLDEIVELLRKEGFRLCGLIPGLSDASSGTLLQVDGIFMRAEPS